MFQYEANDDIVTDAQESFRINCFTVILDRANSSIDTRSQQLQSINDIFDFLYSFRQLSRDMLMKSAKDLEIALSHDECSDVDGYMLAEEMEALKALVPSTLENHWIFYVVAFNAADDFSAALRILLTIPVTVASGERSFSKLKLIKTTYVGQERLNNLAILSVEDDVARSLNYADVIDSFVAAKSRKVPL